VVQAEVSVTRSGKPVRPTAVTCTSSFADDDRYARQSGPSRSFVGAVRCYFTFNNAKYRGKTLVGEVAVSVGRTKTTRTFSVRVGAGSVLSRPVGAVIAQPTSTQPAPSASDEWRGMLHVVHVHGGPGQPGWNTSLNLRLTLLPGATKRDPLGWTQPVSWVATYSSEFYSNTPCTDSSGRAVPNRLEERIILRGRTGDPTSSYPNNPRFTENANVAVRWDTRQSQWVIRFNGTRPRRSITKITNDCGKTWRTETGIGGGLPNYTIRVVGTAASTALGGAGRPLGVPESDNATATWNLTLAPTK
jgi:hypothetical protein